MKLILLLAFLFNIGLSPLSTENQVPEPVNVQVSYLFGDTILIEADLVDSTSFDHIDVFLQSENSAKINMPAIISDSGHLRVSYSLDVNPFHVFDRIYYWFEIVTADGKVTSTPAYWFDYLDNRYEWQTSESKWFVVHNVPGNQIAAADIQEIALAGLKDATGLLPVSPNLPMQLYVYPNADSLAIALGINSQPWAVGEANPEIGILLVSESEDIDSLQELKRQIAHEIMHMLEFSAAYGHYAVSPTWLLEGLAVNAESMTSADDLRMLQNAYNDGTLFSFDQLCTSFPPEASQSSLAYAQSASFTAYLSETFGNDKLLALLQAGGNGLNCSQMTIQVIGKDLATLEAEWKTAVFIEESRTYSFTNFWPLLLLLPIIVWGLIRIRKHGVANPNNESINGK